MVNFLAVVHVVLTCMRYFNSNPLPSELVSRFQAAATPYLNHSTIVGFYGLFTGSQLYTYPTRNPGSDATICRPRLPIEYPVSFTPLDDFPHTIILQSRPTSTQAPRNDFCLSTLPIQRKILYPVTTLNDIAAYVIFDEHILTETGDPEAKAGIYTGDLEWNLSSHPELKEHLPACALLALVTIMAVALVNTIQDNIRLAAKLESLRAASPVPTCPTPPSRHLLTPMAYRQQFREKNRAIDFLKAQEQSLMKKIEGQEDLITNYTAQLTQNANELSTIKDRLANAEIDYQSAQEGRELTQSRYLAQVHEATHLRSELDAQLTDNERLLGEWSAAERELADLQTKHKDVAARCSHLEESLAITEAEQASKVEENRCLVKRLQIDAREIEFKDKMIADCMKRGGYSPHILLPGPPGTFTPNPADFIPRLHHDKAIKDLKENLKFRERETHRLQSRLDSDRVQIALLKAEIEKVKNSGTSQSPSWSVLGPIAEQNTVQTAVPPSPPITPEAATSAWVEKTPTVQRSSPSFHSRSSSLPMNSSPPLTSRALPRRSSSNALRLSFEEESSPSASESPVLLHVD